MKLSTKGRYAVMAMADIALNDDTGHPVPLGDIAVRQAISQEYLEQLFAKLRRARLVDSARGPGGGYTLAREPDEIWIADIVQAVDEPLQVTRCQGDAIDGCVGGEKCVTHELWAALGRRLRLPLDRHPWRCHQPKKSRARSVGAAGQGSSCQNHGLIVQPGRIYLDHNAMSPLRPEARAAMIAALDACGNASSVHGEGRAARHRIEAAREAVARALAARPAMVVFTSGGTEANALALCGARADRLMISAVEHPSMRAAAERSGKPVEIMPVAPTGIVDLSALERSLAIGEGRALLSLMLANNETGAIQPVAEAAALVHRHGGLVHSDAAQAVGRLPVNWAELGVDLLTVSAHKFGGPAGAGALVIDERVEISPLIAGGGQELHRRGGTENVAAISAMGVAIGLAERDDLLAIGRLRHHMELGLKARSPDLQVFSEGVPRLPNTSCFALEGLLAETALMALDLNGVAVSTGSACSSGKIAVSPVLEAMGVRPSLARSALRVSLGWSTREGDVERLLDAWQELVARLEARSAA